MRELVLMARGAEQMNVPVEKVQAYLDEGWREISRSQPQPVAPVEPVAVETVTESAPVAPVAPASKKDKGK